MSFERDKLDGNTLSSGVGLHVCCRALRVIFTRLYHLHYK